MGDEVVMRTIGDESPETGEAAAGSDASRPIPKNAGMAAIWALPRCGARNRAGQPCQRPRSRFNARCSLHGGNARSGRPIEHGRRSRKRLIKARKIRKEFRTAIAKAKQAGLLRPKA